MNEMNTWTFVPTPSPSRRLKCARRWRRRKWATMCIWMTPLSMRYSRRLLGCLVRRIRFFVPSGTMGNLLALLVHCQRGDEVIVGDQSHVYMNEAGGMSALGGIHPRPLRNQRDGTLFLDDIRASIQTEDVHHTITRLICIENTQNVCGGVPLTAEYTAQVGRDCKEQWTIPSH
jgi:threonine aldolase